MQLSSSILPSTCTIVRRSAIGSLLDTNQHTLNPIRMSRPFLYSAILSPPCRAVLLTVNIAGIDIDVKEVNLINGDHRTEEYLKMNPQHTVPTLNDNGFSLSDSHAITTYLIDKYAKDDSLYPKDIQKRALVNQFLHFNNSMLFPNLKGICFPIAFKGLKEIPQERVELLTTACEFLEKYIGDNDWLVGDTYTLADIHIISTVSGLPIVLSLDQFPKIVAWVKRCEDKIPGYKTANVPGNTQFMDFIRSCISN